MGGKDHPLAKVDHRGARTVTWDWLAPQREHKQLQYQVMQPTWDREGLAAPDIRSWSSMEAGPWTGKGCSAPWMYHRVAGQYTLLEKQLVSDFAPCRRRPSPRVLRDSTNWHEAQQAPSPWGPRRQEGGRVPEREAKRAATPRSPTCDGLLALCGREPAWRAAPTARPAAACGEGPLGKLLPARSPPSYEAHLLLRAAQGPRKENRPRPPPYVAPPAYEAAHRTVRPQPGGSRAASAGGKAGPAAERDGAPRTPSAGRRGAQGQATGAGRWSCPVGARTWGGRRRWAGRAEASSGWAPDWPRTPPPRSHTLPRVAKGPPADRPLLPPGWAWRRAAGQGSPERKGPGRAGGLLVIDATCVVIQTHYIPPARPERVRYLGRPGPPTPSPALASASLQERASRILGLPPDELAFPEQGEPASPGHRAEGRCPAEAAAAGALPTLARPERASCAPQGSPRHPGPLLAPGPVPAEPPEEGPAGLEVAGRGGDGCGALAAAEPSRSPPHRSYVRDLREAMSRIRRHTAPDSDTDEELEKERRAASRRFPWKGRLDEGALSYSSSSLESIGSDATVVPGNATSGTQSNGPRRGRQTRQAVP